MRNIWAITYKELNTYLSSPIAYVLAAVFIGLAGLLFSLSLGGSFPEATVRGFVGPGVVLLLVVGSLLTMRLLAEEQKLGTLELLLTSPIIDAQVVLGKFLASFLIIVGMLVLSLYFPILLFVFGDPDPMPIVTGYLAMVVVGMTALAIGIFSSSLTSNQIVAVVISLGINFILVITDIASRYTSGLLADVLRYVSVSAHTSDLLLGILDSRHILYFLSITVFFLFVTVRMLESRRWR
ncbi:MAG: hypothetical protein FI725_07020 [SAR202 cluster bacterium]|nr:hypothetical protein [SAR202 cluster bacterium]|tara:strand:+ start:1377 stop:2090 length:714 start_codon:yes stop_codon:yes gene_type:complete